MGPTSPTALASNACVQAAPSQHSPHVILSGACEASTHVILSGACAAHVILSGACAARAVEGRAETRVSWAPFRRRRMQALGRITQASIEGCALCLLETSTPDQSGT